MPLYCRHVTAVTTKTSLANCLPLKEPLEPSSPSYHHQVPRRVGEVDSCALSTRWLNSSSPFASNMVSTSTSKTKRRDVQFRTSGQTWNQPCEGEWHYLMRKYILSSLTVVFLRTCTQKTPISCSSSSRMQTITLTTPVSCRTRRSYSINVA